MSSAYAIAAVSAVLKDLLNDGIINGTLDVDPNSEAPFDGDVTVSVIAPDRIDPIETKRQVNLFMYQVMPNIGWRNVGLPSRSADGERLTNRPLALDLHYFLTAYGINEFDAEMLLGYAMQLLHETPVLTRAAIKDTLADITFPATHTANKGEQLKNSGLAEQVEQIKITPLAVNGEEMARLWTAMQAKYRPTVAYQVSVVLIERNYPTKTAIPVVKRGEGDRGPRAQANLIPPFPTIESIMLPNNQLAALVGDEVVIKGHDFAGETGDATKVTVIVQLASLRLPEPIIYTVLSTRRSDTEIRFRLENFTTQPQLVVGSYILTIQVIPNDSPKKAIEVSAALLVAPKITEGVGQDVSVTLADIEDGMGTATIPLKCIPRVMPEQRASLLLGDREIFAEAHPAPTDTLTFTVRKVLPDTYNVRLRVDRVESLLVDRSILNKPELDPTQRITLELP